uniref:Uncharacterized protein n=1 Tax=Pyxicephalus adspersus TaxID=30357 RepID=A0AAV3ADV9_PYXAD|nr:TPA: hypothetical protein GDO54_012692 [Pyxicephalus adspersus]
MELSIKKKQNKKRLLAYFMRIPIPEMLVITDHRHRHISAFKILKMALTAQKVLHKAKRRSIALNPSYMNYIFKQIGTLIFAKIFSSSQNKLLSPCKWSFMKNKNCSLTSRIRTHFYSQAAVFLRLTSML